MESRGRFTIQRMYMYVCMYVNECIHVVTCMSYYVVCVCVCVCVCKEGDGCEGGPAVEYSVSRQPDASVESTVHHERGHKQLKILYLLE